MNPLESQLNLQEDLKVKAARRSFWIFFRDIFSVSHMKVEGKFVAGEFIKSRCDAIQFNRKKVEVASRKHIKTTLRQAKVMWYLFRLDESPKFYHFGSYFSASKKAAHKRTKKINDYIAANPYFNGFKKLTDSESLVHYQTPGGKKFTYEPAGIFEFSRGDALDDAILDDVQRDDETEELVQTTKVKETFEQVIVPLVKVDGEIDIVGTPQDEDDMLLSKRNSTVFHFSFYPIWKDELRTVPQWPENFTVEYIKELENSIRKNAFDQEYMCVPARSADGYFIPEEVRDIVNKDLVAFVPHETYQFNGVLKAGFDIGKKRHPSHLVVFEEINGKMKQRLSFYMEEWDYIRQVEFLKMVIKNWGIKLLVYDNTRSEFEALFEGGDLPREMTPMTFTTKTKFKMATSFENHVMKKDVELLNEARQTRQILGVDNKLQSIETMDGHGEAFWSIGMALEGFDQTFIEVAQPVFEEKSLNEMLAKTERPLRAGNLVFDASRGRFNLEKSDKPTLGIFLNPSPDIEYRIGVYVPEELDRPIVAVVKSALDKNQAALYYSKGDLDQVAKDLDVVGRYYNHAHMVVNNDPRGLQILNMLEKDITYDNVFYDISKDERRDEQTEKLGFTMTEESKTRLVSLQKALFRDKKAFLKSAFQVNAHLSLMKDVAGRFQGRNEEYVWSDCLSSFLCHEVPTLRSPEDPDEDIHYVNWFQRNKSEQCA